MKTVALIEGFSGGPIKTRRFRKALVDAGFKIIKNSSKADIVIAHSAGIYAIPASARANLLMLIGPTYWPGRSLYARLRQHMGDSRRYYVSRFGRLYYTKKKILEVYYFFIRHKYLWLGIVHNNRLEKLQQLTSRPGRKTIIIRNTDDAYSGRGLEQQIKDKNVTYVELPGIHDDYYENPGPYIELLLKAADF